MFLSEDHISHDTLMQGDVVNDIQLLGALNIHTIRYSTSVADPNDISAWTVQAPPKKGPAMVLSHSCEIDRSNMVKVTSIILAPLRDVSSATSPDKIAELKDTNLIDESEPRASFLKYFYVEPNGLLPFTAGAIVDFSKCFSARNKSYDFLLENKILEIEDKFRKSMALKLGLYFHRQY